MNNDLIKILEDKIDKSESRIAAIQNYSEEIWQESGYYLQQDIDAEISYCSVLYKKLHKLQEEA